MGRKSNSEIIFYPENPFLGTLTVPTKSRTVNIGLNPDNVLVSTETGEVRSTFIGIRKEVDTEEYVKIYTSCIEKYLDLSKAGQKAFHILLKTLQKTAINKDIVSLADNIRVDCCKSEDLQVSKSTFSRGKDELLEKQIIAHCSLGSNLYYINPAVVFNGNRLVIVNEFIAKKNEELRTIPLNAPNLFPFPKESNPE